ncbi:MAG: RDD family protein [Actinomycetota bacterium]
MPVPPAPASAPPPPPPQTDVPPTEPPAPVAPPAEAPPPTEPPAPVAPPAEAPAPTEPPAPVAPPAEAPAPTESVAAESSTHDDDLSDLLDRLHEEMDIVHTGDVEVGTELTDARDLERPEQASITVETAGGIDFDPTFAGFGRRFVGFVVDTVIVNAALLPGLALAFTGSALLVFLGVLLALAGFLAVCWWGARSIAATGKWVGNRVTDTTVVDARTGRLLDIGAAAGRVVTRHLLSPILLLGFLPALVDPQRRTFHDRIATSVVIARPREVWTPGDGD